MNSETHAFSYEVALPADFIAANLGMQVDSVLASSGFKSITRGPAGMSWQRSFDLTQKLAISILGLVALVELGSMPNGLIVIAICLAAISVLWLLRGPQRFQIVLTAHVTGTTIAVADGRNKSALRTVEAFANSHGGVPAGGLTLLRS